MTHIANEITTRLLDAAGIGEGMRVLEIGCARGDLSIELARRVGPSGHVLGIDRDPRALAAAARQARALGLPQLSFTAHELGHEQGRKPPEAGPFDAVVGRRVLMYLRDPAEVLRGLVPLLRRGGKMAFQEHDATVVPARTTPMPLHEQVSAWTWETVKREGANVGMGFALYETLEAAGLRVEGLRAEAIVQTPSAPYPLDRIVEAMLPRIVAQGVATEEEIDLPTLGERLKEERDRIGATFLTDLAFCGWATKRA